MSKFVILHKRKTPRFHVLYNESAKTNICNIYERRCLSQILYIIPHSYTTSLKIKLMQILFEPSNKPSYEYPNQYFHFRISWKNHGLC